MIISDNPTRLTYPCCGKAKHNQAILSRIARLRIRGKKYNDRRRKEMMAEAEYYAINVDLFEPGSEVRALYEYKEMMYHKRAVWYIIKNMRK